MANSKEHDVSQYFLELKAAHERIVDELKHDALKGDVTYKQAKDYIEHQLELVPNVRAVRRDDADMFMGLVQRAKNSIQRDQDSMKVNKND